VALAGYGMWHYRVGVIGVFVPYNFTYPDKVTSPDINKAEHYARLAISQLSYVRPPYHVVARSITSPTTNTSYLISFGGKLEVNAFVEFSHSVQIAVHKSP
jgi:hypothetical protein